MYRAIILASLAFGVFTNGGEAATLPQDPSQVGGPVTAEALLSDTPAAAPSVTPEGAQAVKPVAEGPLHEAFLSPRKDRAPLHVEKTPPPPIAERPGVEAPSADAEWIEGYWEWDPGKKDFIWVTGTWRVSPPGRFWVNGYWKRDQDGWYRVPGFWSDRKTDRLDYRKDGPPKDRPDDGPGEPPAPDCFYVPGHYAPDGDGVTWKKGFWTKSQPGWAWVPAQWVRQPEGWVFQEGYWDRTLEDRGTLFAPAVVDSTAKAGEELSYQPYTQVSPEMYGQLYGAFGRPNANYDGYPGVYYDEDGRFYGYANYGSLCGYYGYLDYPYYGGYGYPYISTPVVSDVGYGYGYSRMGSRSLRRSAGRLPGLRRLRFSLLRRARLRLSRIQRRLLGLSLGIRRNGLRRLGTRPRFRRLGLGQSLVVASAASAIPGADWAGAASVSLGRLGRPWILRPGLGWPGLGRLGFPWLG